MRDIKFIFIIIMLIIGILAIRSESRSLSEEFGNSEYNFGVHAAVGSVVHMGALKILDNYDEVWKHIAGIAAATSVGYCIELTDSVRDNDDIMGYTYGALLAGTGYEFIERTKGAGNRVYFGTYFRHYGTDIAYHEGSNPVVGYGREFNTGYLKTEYSAIIFEDSFEQPSVTMFANISHEKLRLRYVTPILSVGVVTKGKDFEGGRQTYLYILPKVRFSKDNTGLFADLVGVYGCWTILVGWAF